jgi:pSer/pThr/pTyr-binding forkhead associated (FHA) protein
MPATFLLKTGKKFTGRVTAESIRIGVRASCELVLEGRAEPRRPQTFVDPIAADEHCEISVDSHGFWIRDLGTASGTWVNGLPVEDRVPLSPGAEIVVGASRIGVEIDSTVRPPQLTLSLQPHSFHFTLRNSGKGEFDSDADRMALDEVGIGSLVPLRYAGWLSVPIGLMLLAVAFSFRQGEETLLQPGALCDRHELIFDDARSHDEVAAMPFASAAMTSELVSKARSKGCGTCHAPGGGVEQSACASCHGTWLEKRHPWRSRAEDAHDASKVTRPWDEAVCVECHVEHRGPGSAKSNGLVPGMEFPNSCDSCHAGTDIASRNYSSEKDSAPLPLATPRPHLALAFSHEAHLAPGKEIACGACHRIDESLKSRSSSDPQVGRPKERLPVTFELCESCHGERRNEALRDFWPRETWTIAWHGAGDPSKCLACHTAVHSAELRSVERIDDAVLATLPLDATARFRMSFRVHEAHFDRFKDRCDDCHRQPARGLRRGLGTFRHSTHIAGGLDPRDAAARRELSAASCAVCHAGIAASTGLAAAGGVVRVAESEVCAKCHKDDSGVAYALAHEPTAELASAVRERRADFPHAPHVGSSHPGLSEGCFSCHEFRGGEFGALDARARVREDRSDCSSSGCHAQHENVGGGACAKCHTMGAGLASVYFGPTPPSDRRAPSRLGPPASGFSHFVPEHEALACKDCHQVGTGVPGKDLALASSLATVPVPDESWKVCQDCHRRRRFHW